ncbi:UDP-2,3-diacylglucosamine diphosphatase [Emticicia sp. SJ17W-69]|uniref:UDP-2,3-diacylglucosamine diphosphatase n=1 Tax=Emticicia sp. SJ17W-69 TaxID=3421657 RepID=UPI003EBCCFED
MNRQIPAGKKIYFASDFHLGGPDHEKSLIRERKIITWLESIRHDAEIIFLVGDLFDFWFEYRRVVPKGFVRFFGKLAELSDSGIEIIVFMGNRDMWMTDYFEKELNIKTIRRPKTFTFNDKTFYIGHGDGLGADDFGYKMLKIVFEGKIPRFLFGRILHPNLGMLLGRIWTKHSWRKKRTKELYLGDEKEHLVMYSKDIEASKHHDFYVFGHRHNVVDMNLTATARYINLGDWIWHYSYAIFDGKNMAIKAFQ